jgi:hypothetical protein
VQVTKDVILQQAIQAFRADFQAADQRKQVSNTASEQKQIGCFPSLGVYATVARNFNHSGDRKPPQRWLVDSVSLQTLHLSFL